MTRKRKKFSADFETTTILTDCRVWAYGYMEIGNKTNSAIGNNIDVFMEWLEEIKADVFFHNLKFDGEFIVNWLLHHGWTHSKDKEAGTFNCLISSMAQWYSIEIIYGYKKDGKPIKTVLYDSLKKLPFKVERIAKAFKLEMAKGEIDYHKFRPVGHIIDDEEKDYIEKDVAIVADALLEQFKEGLTGMTAGGDSLRDYKDRMGGKKKFEKKFPIFTKQMDDKFRPAYKGGFTWVNKRYKGQVIGEGMVFDVNSLYPSVMYEKFLPYGHPIKYKGKYKEDSQFPLFIQHLRCEFSIKKDCIPCIQIKTDSRFKKTEYLEHSHGHHVDLHVTSVDLALIEEHYHLIDVEYVGGYKFMGAYGLFTDFIDYWMEKKINSTGAKKELAKLMLNSLYGKFASNPDVTGKEPYLGDKGECKFRLMKEEYADPVYTPMGAFITAYARDKTIRTAQACFDRIVYCDTDSIHITGREVPESIKDVIDDDKLGYWAHESNFKRGKYLRQKTYCYEILQKEKIKNGKVVKDDEGITIWINASFDDYTRIKFSVKCAGMTDKVKEDVTFENFVVGFTSEKKLSPVHVMGGVVLVNSTFKVKQEKKWIVA